MFDPTAIEARIDSAARHLLNRWPGSGILGSLTEFVVFGFKQAWACLFAGLFLSFVLATAVYWPAGAFIHRYDFLFAVAVIIQVLMLGLQLERPSEALVILVFHLVGTGMELFKTAHGSWSYPEASLFHIAGVPLFSGFMYAAVGSYIARATRIFDFQYLSHPPQRFCAALAMAIYVNFFTDQLGLDFRWILFVATALLFWRTSIHYRVFRFRHRMPLLLGFVLVTLFIWLAENIGTWSRVWLYPNQRLVWSMVSLSKFGSWFLLMIVSFVLVNMIHPPKAVTGAEGQESLKPQP